VNGSVNESATNITNTTISKVILIHFVTGNNLVAGSRIFPHKTLRKLWNSLYGNTRNKVDRVLLICRRVH
jgi:hypothetical protein